MDEQIKQFFASENDAGERLDASAAKRAGLSRQYVKKLIDAGDVKVNGKTVKASYKLKAGDEVAIRLPEAEPTAVLPEDIPLDIVYEDADLLVVNKPSGMVVHPAPGHSGGTLVNALLYHTKDLSGINGELRPGIVHRIDRDTSGLLVVAKNDIAHRGLAAQLSEHAMDRQYRAVVCGVVAAERGTVNMPIGRHPKDRVRMAAVEGGKPAVTHFEVVERYERFTQMIFHLETGRTHQIRVHMAQIGHPVAGDPLYGGDRRLSFHTEGQCLHAEVLGFIHPTTGEHMRFTAPLPEDFLEVLRAVKGEKR